MIDFKAELNSEQLRVVTEGEGPCLVLAGAGSGKTRALTYRVAYLLEHGVAPENILLLTFTNKAAREMLERVRSLVGQKISLANLAGGTFHSVANKLLRRHATALGYQPNFSILDEDDAETLLKKCLRDEGIDSSSKKFPSAGVIKDWLSFSSNAQLPLTEVIDLKNPRFLSAEPVLAAAAEHYRRAKVAANAMDFDDLLLNWWRLLNTNRQVFKNLSSRFQYILVDEFQDTNKLQAQIVNKLASEHKNLLVVGDDAQSIYSFRAADINNILDFQKVWPKAKVFKLEINYRSTPDILNLANQVIARNTKQFSKTLTSEKMSALKPKVLAHPDALGEADFVAKKILSLQDDGVPLSQMAVLFRAAWHAQALEVELARRGISYDFRGGLRFFERAHIKDVISFLRLVNNIHDAIAWWRVLELQSGIGPVAANIIVEKVKTVSELEKVVALDLGASLRGEAKVGWQNFVGILKSVIQSSDRSPASLITILAESAYRDYLENNFDNYESRLADLERLASFSAKSRGLSEFLSTISLDDNYASGSAEGRKGQEKIVLSTIHQAKGLEWEAVFLINLVAGAFPNERALSEEGGEEEERRLFYVALTRPKRYLFLNYPMISSRDDGGANRPSNFLLELGKDLVETVGNTDPTEPVYYDEEEKPKHTFKARGKFMPPSPTAWRS